MSRRRQVRAYLAESRPEAERWSAAVQCLLRDVTVTADTGECVSPEAFFVQGGWWFLDGFTCYRTGDSSSPLTTSFFHILTADYFPAVLKLIECIFLPHVSVHVSILWNSTCRDILNIQTMNALFLLRNSGH